MRSLVESLKRLYESGKVSAEIPVDQLEGYKTFRVLQFIIYNWSFKINNSQPRHPNGI